VLTSRQLVDFVVLDVEPAGPSSSGKFVLADVQVRDSFIPRILQNRYMVLFGLLNIPSHFVFLFLGIPFRQSV
jgi:hypothetical protein